jgi:hypothetical protein
MLVFDKQRMGVLMNPGHRVLFLFYSPGEEKETVLMIF